MKVFNKNPLISVILHILRKITFFFIINVDLTKIYNQNHKTWPKIII